MTAEIRKIDRDARRVFGFAPGVPDERDWYQALLKTCGGSTCTVSSGDLIEFSRFDNEKQQKIGFDLGTEGVWLGLQIRSDQLWKAIESGKPSTFDVDIGQDGVHVEFQISKQNGGKKMPQLQNSDFDLVSRCIEAVDSGDLGNLTKKDFQAALDSLAKSFAVAHAVGFYRAYGQIFATEIGSKLYAGYSAAPGVPTNFNKAAEDDGPPSWQTIKKRAKELRERQPQLTEAVAVCKVIDADPRLYEAYDRETRGA